MNGEALLPDDGTLLEELGWVHALACRLLSDTNDADDVVQEAWLKARHTPAERFANRSRLRAWLAAVTRRMARDTLRARGRRARREARAAQSESVAGPGDVVERSAQLEDLLHTVRGLAEPYRSTVLLRYMDGLTTSEVAARTSASEELVRKRLSRALARLRDGLQRERGGALPVRVEEDLARAPCGAPPASRATSVRWLAGLGLALLAFFGLRALTELLRTAPETPPVALDTPSSLRDSGAVPSGGGQSDAASASSHAASDPSSSPLVAESVDAPGEDEHDTLEAVEAGAEEAPSPQPGLQPGGLGRGALIGSPAPNGE